MKVGENMCHINLNSHAKFHGDQTIGGAITGFLHEVQNPYCNC